MATANVAGNIQFIPSFNEIISTGLLNTLNLPASLNIQNSYTNATTGALTVDQIHAKVYTLAASATTIDLTSLLDLNGAAMNFTRVRDFIVVNNDTTVSHVVKVSQGASNGWSFLPPAANFLTCCALGGVIWLHDPQSSLSTNGMITDGTHKTILLDPGAFTINLSVLIVGGSAT